jgi:hypothetical protein
VGEVTLGAAPFCSWVSTSAALDSTSASLSHGVRTHYTY